MSRQHRKERLIIACESPASCTHEQYDTRSFQRKTGRRRRWRTSVIKRTLLLEHCVSFLWANKLHEGKLWSTCSYCHTLTHPHSHTFPFSTQHPILSKDEERGQALHAAKATYSYKNRKPSVFSLTKPWYVPQSHWGLLCVSTFVVLCWTGWL